jgi:hypothetical protein
LQIKLSLLAAGFAIGELRQPVLSRQKQAPSAAVIPARPFATH